MSPRSSTRDEYERGGPQSIGIDSNAITEDQSLLGDHGNDQVTSRSVGLRLRRRSSVSRHLTALTDLGGVNSIRSFSRSWARAAGFPEVIPQRPSFVFAPDQAPVSTAVDGLDYSRTPVDAATPHQGTSLLRQHIEAARPDEAGSDAGSHHGRPGPSLPRGVVFGQHHHPPGDRDGDQKAVDAEMYGANGYSSSFSSRASIFASGPPLASPPIVGSYGSYRTYGTLSDADRSSMIHAGDLWHQQQTGHGGVPADGDHQPILVKEVEQDGKIILAVEGQSTLPQTIFNSINVLIGVGLLSLPLGIKYAGWIFGMITLFLCAAVTAYTAKLLAKCMDLDPSLITFSDLAYISYGRNARIVTSILFTMELLAACVALIVLFADTLALLFPGVLSVNMWKVICSMILMPLNFFPLRFLSFTSVVGIFSCFSIVLIIVIDGFIKKNTPGSLVEPAVTHLFPTNWLTLPLSFGLLMAPWGGHSVFPNIYRDMRHPYKFGKAVKVTFAFSYSLDAVTAVVGLLMFGDDVLEEITSNILTTSGYPNTLTFLMCVFVSILPLTKIPLNARPIISTLETLAGIHYDALADNQAMVGRSASFRGAMKVAIRVFTILAFLGIAIVFPSFDSIMAFMGSALCFTICVSLPVAFYLKLFSREISTREKLLCYVIMVISTILSAVGTVWAFLPKSVIGVVV
ncbi:hypothetical protein ACRALDRAFT_1076284 [Sodiomyces alcalophilus JCM 7366]|uniref:uncharacterized protein n=1 Tax=Sodiomyces alcalophilus JCM 7366 TaxID=591952 RepID=UPI0039B4CAAE